MKPFLLIIRTASPLQGTPTHHQTFSPDHQAQTPPQFPRPGRPLTLALSTVDGVAEEALLADVTVLAGRQVAARLARAVTHVTRAVTITLTCCGERTHRGPVTTYTYRLVLLPT